MKKISSVDEYLKSLPKKDRSVIENIRATVKAAAPRATEAISYGMPVFKYRGALVGVAAFRDHCSLFVMNATYIASHRDELKGYKLSKGTIQFSADKPLPQTLVRKIVKGRMKENEAKL